MKKQILAVLFLGLMSGVSHAAVENVCSGGEAKEVKVKDPAGFIVTTFKPKCSANTIVDYEDLDSMVAVAGASVKGGNSFMANSAGGSVLPFKKCAGKVCAQTDVDDAMTKAKTLGSGAGS
ncbi:hypothetical protein [Chitinimonas taiwanensis]|uniref:Uncharacterized protein n=1 Tax=Chitinimonas taiwanensis DSM 18899 TaxID=1121279 RepID=A0A1K2HE33_9NEIS|nr:hypothetical protein [Chitinimonas taiwanensis]SFZ74570.1 hypothetical protein SAMN02745887_01311 [Chitinimonas taiwanensis DSM 18899]